MPLAKRRRVSVRRRNVRLCRQNGIWDEAGRIPTGASDVLDRALTGLLFHPLWNRKILWLKHKRHSEQTSKLIVPSLSLEDFSRVFLLFLSFTYSFSRPKSCNLQHTHVFLFAMVSSMARLPFFWPYWHPVPWSIWCFCFRFLLGTFFRHPLICQTTYHQLQQGRGDYCKLHCDGQKHN